MPSFTSTLKKELFSVKVIGISLFVAVLYICLSVFLPNIRLFTTLSDTNTPFLSQVGVFATLVTGLGSSLSQSDFILTILTALLVGINIALLVQTVSMLEHKGKIRVSVGGATLVSLVATGCTSCGLSLLSVLGLSASMSFLPFHGMELHMGAITLLLISIVYLLRQLHISVYCKLPARQTVSQGK